MSFSITIGTNGSCTYIIFFHTNGKLLSFSNWNNKWVFHGAFDYDNRSKPSICNSLADVEDIVSLQKLLELVDEHF